MNSSYNFFTPLPSVGTEEGEQVRKAQLSAYQSQIQLQLVASICSIAFIFAVFYGTAPIWLLSGGASLIAIVSLSRTLHAVMARVFHGIIEEKLEKSTRWVTVLTWLCAGIWGGWLVMLFGYASETQKIFLGIVALGNAVTALSGLVAVPRAAAGFAALNLLPLLTLFFISGDRVLSSIASMGFLFFVIMLISTRRHFNNFIARLTSEFSHSRQLSRLSNRYEDYLHTSSDWVWETERNQKFTYCSDRREELTGIPNASLINQRRSDVLDEEEMSDEWREHFAILSAHKPFTDFAYPYTHPEGMKMWFSISGKPNFDAQGKFLGYRGCGSDITEKVEAETKRREAEQALRDANLQLEKRVRERTIKLKTREEELRLARDEALEASQAKSQFLATMSHEIRTPMNGVLGMTELLMETGLTSRQTRFAEIILRSGKSLMEIINDILDLSKIESGKLDLEIISFNLIDTLKDVSELFDANARKKGITMSLEIGPDVYESTLGDPVRLRQILMNLLSNAIKFTDQGGVKLQVNRIDNDLVRFEVSDTGIGIPEEALEDIFEMFSQAEQSTTRRFGGTGLGLSISRQLTEMMGGVLSVESTKGEGSTFRFTAQLPEANLEAETSEVLQSYQSTTQPKGNSLTILVAEDNPVNQVVAAESLAQLGMKAVIVANGLEAVEEARNYAYGLILMDVEMPELDGCGAARKIRADQKSESDQVPVPIIAMTADNGMEARQRCEQAGMNDYLPKPFSLEELKCTIDKWAQAQA